MNVKHPANWQGVFVSSSLRIVSQPRDDIPLLDNFAIYSYYERTFVHILYLRILCSLIAASCARYKEFIMNHGQRPVIIAVVVVLALIIGGISFLRASATEGDLTVSGTIEATEIHIQSQLGGTITRVFVSKGDVVRVGQKLLSLHSGVNLNVGGMSETLTSPINGVILDRTVEQGETAAPGSALIVLADLNTMTLTVYVPENRYGQVRLGQIYPVRVDSFPDETFTGRVSHIASQAEFTPRNVQTVEGRETTVFAITLDLEAPDGKLKPGMPADVTFGQ
jgi:multidrug efflux pump subunit AcrA (membrane-fusion protein)